MNEAIILENVSRCFGKKTVLSSVNAKTLPGRVIGLLGRNGEGKTTLIKILLDIIAPDCGSAFLCGARADGTGTIRKLAGYVPERPVFRGFSDFAEVFEMRARFFPSWDAEKAAMLAAKLGFSPQEKISSASKGTLGKAAWVCAAAHNPAVFLLDEPTGGLDALIREKLIFGFIEELQNEGKTFLIASHRLDDFAPLLDEIWLLSGGKLICGIDAAGLRSGGRIITGRLKEGKTIPPDIPASALAAEPPIVRLAVLSAKAADQVLAADFLENAQSASLPFEKALSVLLADGGKLL